MKGSFWWIDRWRQSTAYSDMTAEEQGLYRNLCDEVWVREDHIIPDDPRILARVSGDPEAWSRCGEKVLTWMTRVEGGWTQETARKVCIDSERRAENQRRYRARKDAPDNEVDNGPDNGSNNEPDNDPDNKPASLSLSQQTSNNPDPETAPVEEEARIFEAWRVVMETPSAKFTAERRRVVRARLRDGYSEEQIISAIHGCKASGFHMGQNENRRKYNDLTLICRNGSKLESFMGIRRQVDEPLDPHEARGW